MNNSPTALRQKLMSIVCHRLPAKTWSVATPSTIKNVTAPQKASEAIKLAAFRESPNPPSFIGASRIRINQVIDPNRTNFSPAPAR